MTRPQQKHRLLPYLRRSLISALTILIAIVFTAQIPVAALTPAERRRDAFRGISFTGGDECTEDNNSGSVSGSLPSNIPPAWREVITKAAAAKNTSASLLAALYLTENGNVWHDFERKWDTTQSSGAQGPMQFLPTTWEAHKQDGDGNGVMDIMNVWDSVFAAADMIAGGGFKVTPTTPLGNLDKPLTRNTLLYAAYAYNQGPGTAERTSADITLDDLRTNPIAHNAQEGYEYVENVYALISSGFTKKGKPAYGDPRSDMKNPGDSSSAPVTASPSVSQGCSCNVSGNGKTVVLDPGHSGKSISKTDKTGLTDEDYPNDKEIDDVFEVAQNAKAQLEKAGYTVIMTKSAVSDSVSLRDRAEKANQANADLAISIHTQADLPFATRNNIVYYQDDVKVGGNYLQYRRVSKDPNSKHVYALEGAGITADQYKQIADKSKAYAQIFKQERGAAEGHDIRTTNDATNDIGTRLPSPGSIWMVQIFSKVPWIYNEAGGQSPGMSMGLNSADKQKYADGIVKSVEKILPGNGAAAAAPTTGGCPTGTGKDAIVSKILEFAWPNFCARAGGPCSCEQDVAKYCTGYDNALTKKPAYEAAVQRAKQARDDGNPKTLGYTGDGCYGGGVDCGAFVTIVMRESGADPQYNDKDCNTACQLKYLQENSGPGKKYTHITDLKSLQTGDIAVQNNGAINHTFFYVGDIKYPDGTPFHGSTASASQCNRAPMASSLGSEAPDYEWYRLN